MSALVVALCVASASAASVRLAPTARPRACGIRCLAADDDPILLFDPRSDDLPFPFPVPAPANALDDDTRAPSTYRYAFDRAVHLRMLRDAVGDDGQIGSQPILIGHVCKPGDGEAVGALALGSDSLVRVGSVGVAVRLVDVQFAPRQAARGAEFGEEVAMVSVLAAFRFALTDVTSTFPYPRGCVRQLRDDPPPDASECAALETEVQAALSALVELSAKMESRGEFAAEAEEVLASGPSALLNRHELNVMGGVVRVAHRGSNAGARLCGVAHPALMAALRAHAC